LLLFIPFIAELSRKYTNEISNSDNYVNSADISQSLGNTNNWFSQQRDTNTNTECRCPKLKKLVSTQSKLRISSLIFDLSRTLLWKNL